MCKLRAVMALLWLATVAAAPTPTPTPSTNPVVTPPVATAPPPHGNVDLSAAAGSAGSKVTVTGNGFIPGEAIVIYLDATDHPLGHGAVADGSGAFTQDVTIPDGTPLGGHRVCVYQQPEPRCAQFDVQAPPPTPTATPPPTPTPTASATASPSPAATVGGGSGGSGRGPRPTTALMALLGSPGGLIALLLLFAALAGSI